MRTMTMGPCLSWLPLVLRLMAAAYGALSRSLPVCLAGNEHEDARPAGWDAAPCRRAALPPTIALASKRKQLSKWSLPQRDQQPKFAPGAAPASTFLTYIEIILRRGYVGH